MTDIYAAYWQGNSTPPKPSSGGATGRTYRAPGGFLSVTVGAYSALFQHQIWIVAPYTKMLWDWGEARFGDTADLGVIAAGTPVRFRIIARSGGVQQTDLYSDGPGMKTWRDDELTLAATGSALIGLEDMWGIGGDNDFDDMLLYLNNAGTGGIKRWNGSVWTNLTESLGNAIRAAGAGASGNRWFITDMYFVDGRLWVTWWDDYEDISGVAIHSSGEWTVPFFDTDGHTYTGFVCYKNTTHIFGYGPNNHFCIWKVVGRNRVKLWQESGGAWNFYHCFRGCVIVNPANPSELVCGDGHNDRFAYLNMETGQFTQGSSPGGSCVFALGVDNQRYIWAGDYGSIMYYSQDGHTFSTQLTDGGYPELWELRRWMNNLWGVGCSPCSIISRKATAPQNSLTASWTKEYVSPTLPVRDGMGFMAFQETTEGLYIGFGGEPYYYNRIPRGDNVRATVYFWDGDTLKDIGKSQDWGDGVIAVISSTRSCRPGVLSGVQQGGGVHMDPSADVVGRGIAR